MARLLSLPVLVAVATGAGENIRSVLPSRSFMRRLVGCSVSFAGGTSANSPATTAFPATDAVALQFRKPDAVTLPPLVRVRILWQNVTMAFLPD
jgi:hypothetical protein